MELITRAQWGARAPKGRNVLPTKDLLGMAVHYSASEYDRAPEVGLCDDRVRAIQNYHMNTKKWQDIAYSFLVCHHGDIFEGRGWGIRTAANGTDWGNDHFLAVCFLGADSATRDDVTDTGRKAIHDVILECRRRVQSATAVYSHSDIKATACPGNELRAWLRLGMPLPVPPREEPARVIVNAPQVCVLHHANWDGYLQVTSDGGVFQNGNPPFYGSLGSVALNAPIVDADVTPTGLGYMMLAADGGIFDFGDAAEQFEGGLAGAQLNAPCVSFRFTKTGKGYWIAAKDGGVFSFGDAEFRGTAIEYRG